MFLCSIVTLHVTLHVPGCVIVVLLYMLSTVCTYLWLLLIAHWLCLEIVILKRYVGIVFLLTAHVYFIS